MEHCLLYGIAFGVVIQTDLFPCPDSTNKVIMASILPEEAGFQVDRGHCKASLRFPTCSGLRYTGTFCCAHAPAIHSQAFESILPSFVDAPSC